MGNAHRDAFVIGMIGEMNGGEGAVHLILFW